MTATKATASTDMTDPTNGFPMTSITNMPPTSPIPSVKLPANVSSSADGRAIAAAARRPVEPDGIPTDAEMGRAMVKGWAFGVPGLFAIVVAIALLAGTSLLEAAEIAVFPAIVCGGFLTAAIFIGLASAKAGH